MPEPTSKTPEEGIRDLLVAAQIGTFNATSGWSIVIGRFIDAPNTQIAIVGTGGKAPNPKWNIDYPSVQVRVRGNNSGYVEARQKARDIKDLLLGLPSQDVNGDRWTAVNMIGDITQTGFDQKERPVFAVNFALIIEPSVTGNRETGD